MRCLLIAVLFLFVFPGFSFGEQLIMKSKQSINQTVRSVPKKSGKSPEKKLFDNEGKILASQSFEFGRKYVRYYNDLSMVDAECIIDASKRFNVPVSIILSILDVEGGEVGERADNKNGTWDIGPMQVNTCHMEELSPFGITKYDLQTNGCLNVQAGTWLLRQLLNRNNGKMLEAVGKYHSSNQPFKGRYQRKIINAYKQLKANPMSHIKRIIAKSNEHFKNSFAEKNK